MAQDDSCQLLSIVVASSDLIRQQWQTLAAVYIDGLISRLAATGLPVHISLTSFNNADALLPLRSTVWTAATEARFELASHFLDSNDAPYDANADSHDMLFEGLLRGLEQLDRLPSVKRKTLVLLTQHDFGLDVWLDPELSLESYVTLQPKPRLNQTERYDDENWLSLLEKISQMHVNVSLIALQPTTRLSRWHTRLVETSALTQISPETLGFALPFSQHLVSIAEYADAQPIRLQPTAPTVIGLPPDLINVTPASISKKRQEIAAAYSQHVASLQVSFKAGQITEDSARQELTRAKQHVMKQQAALDALQRKISGIPELDAPANLDPIAQTSANTETLQSAAQKVQTVLPQRAPTHGPEQNSLRYFWQGAIKWEFNDAAAQQRRELAVLCRLSLIPNSRVDKDAFASIVFPKDAMRIGAIRQINLSELQAFSMRNALPALSIAPIDASFLNSRRVNLGKENDETFNRLAVSLNNSKSVATMLISQQGIGHDLLMLSTTTPQKIQESRAPPAMIGLVCSRQQMNEIMSSRGFTVES
ncbi:uncharacterized protein L969DRAFT_45042 [Mixia osmundae IAM 14324]|uniref:Uncharacterized protein n=1 Tax=Mixia osmundae (strain CBS 9802 / IAM 14324 / JCM 22182 / KY 12970) TaxID=764103 RepID=G7DY89_MIXOS|nr:uncharacterized protein L969DRAFT_45042 [Mixia osmundae IAM 14324]KEI41452.1 hypothetical protein L969DRAFT_45042 [Mixia osmundae IAM 14324]GAA95549.1 hypothetical protein E5Q_02204 [Mixia osmundae IAM 14324]